jgi:hypothetical protein
MLTEVPPIVAIRTLATAVAQSRAEVVAQICSLLSIIYRKQAHFLGTNLLKIARGSENLFKLYAVTGTLWSVLQYNKHLYIQRRGVGAPRAIQHCLARGQRRNRETRRYDGKKSGISRWGCSPSGWFDECTYCASIHPLTTKWHSLNIQIIRIHEHGDKIEPRHYYVQ